MAIFDFFSDLFDGSDGDGGLGGGLVDAVLTSSDYLDNEYFPPTMVAAGPRPSVPAIRPPSIMAPAPIVAGAVGGMISRGLARFPALLASIMSWRGRGVSLTVPKLMGMMRKFGPTFLITAGVLTAQAVTDLMMYSATHRRRRMNSLNPRALSRATRRLCSFQSRASRVSSVLSTLAGRSRHRKVGRCAVCHKKPCRC